ncbi:MAG: GxxExxY protein [Alphaproteobacteria bacterium HGW-Alphaproteobacteria-16]|nr:MAG: GxxExxY protein [Alphaproteobacteria bacterium HGW-Alphaproteobacteria-16]
MKDIDRVSGDVLGVALKLHRELGPGLLESAYEALLAARLVAMGYHVARQRPVDIEFDGIRVEHAFRIDLLVDERLVVEIKSIDRLAPVHGKQLLTYLRLLKQPVGLLINFGGATLMEGVKRVVNNHTPSASSASLREQNIAESRREQNRGV